VNFWHLAIAYHLTATIGWEREREEHSTGVRTFPIVGMGSCGYLLFLGAYPDQAARIEPAALKTAAGRERSTRLISTKQRGSDQDSKQAANIASN